LTITPSFALTTARWTHGAKALSTRGDGGAKNCCEKIMCVGALLCALLPSEFSPRGAACDSARCRVRCCCCAR
jgi:hypothetical protein